MFVNCAIIGYNEIKTIILRISLICLGMPPIQLLSNIPANIAPKLCSDFQKSSKIATPI